MYDDDYYGPGSEEYDRDIYEDEQALQDALNDAAHEDCYADYSGGKGPQMRCDYHSGSPSYTSNSESNAISGVIVVFVIIAIITFFVAQSNNRSKY